MIGRRQPYTVLGIGRVPCIRCGRPSVHQWQVCSLDNRYITCCATCDVALNQTVLQFMRVPGARRLLAAYAKRVNG